MEEQQAVTGGRSLPAQMFEEGPLSPEHLNRAGGKPAQSLEASPLSDHARGQVRPQQVGKVRGPSGAVGPKRIFELFARLPQDPVRFGKGPTRPIESGFGVVESVGPGLGSKDLRGRPARIAGGEFGGVPGGPTP